MKIEGTFESEDIGRTQKPAGWVGQGSITFDETGLTLEGTARSNGLISLLAILGLFAGLFAGIALAIVVGLEGNIAGYFALGGLGGGAALGVALTKAKELRAHIAWGAIKKPRLIEDSFVFISKAAPKGQVNFVLRSTSDAADLQTALGHEGIKVEVKHL